MRVQGQVFQEGDWLSLDGTTGRVIKGRLETLPPKADDPELLKLMGWAEPFRKLRVRANADIPRDAIQARAFGAEGIGLCRTEHMFFAEDRIPHMQAMILADNEKDRRAALKKLPCSARILWASSVLWTVFRSPFVPSIRPYTNSFPGAKI
jgi:pyruvate,orthophosphate dikinase